MNRKTAVIISAVVATSSLVACSNSEINNKTEEKTVLTALYWKELPEFEKLVETTYPNIDLQLELSTSAIYSSDILRRLKNGHGTDLVFTAIPNNETMDYMLDLSAQNFSNRFANATMEIIKQEGKTYFLPMPSLYRGIILNKSLIEEMELEVPDNRKELFEVLATSHKLKKGVDSNGYCFAVDLGGIALGEWVMSLAVPDFLGTMEGEQWATDFIAKKAKAHGTLEKYLSFPVLLTENGYMDASRNHINIMNKNAIDIVGEMSNRRMTACYAASTALSTIRERNPKDNYIMLPSLSYEDNNSWTITSPESYLGINEAIEDNEKKVSAAINVLDLFSTAEGQTAVLKDTNTDSSYLIQENVPHREDITGLEHYLEDGYFYNVNRFDTDVIWIIGKNFAEVCSGNMTMEEAMISVDAVNNGAPLSENDDHTLVGSVAEDLIYENFNTRHEETAIGNLIADSIREKTNSDFSFTNGGGIRGSLYKGDVYINDLADVSPYNNHLAVLEVKGEVIYKMLENGISGIYFHDVSNGKFLQVSGLSYKFSIDKSTEIKAEDGERIPCKAQLLSVTLPDGSELDKNGTYTITVTDYMAGISGYEVAGDGFTMLNVFDDSSEKSENVTLVELRDDTARDALISYFKNHSDKNITAKTEQRIVIEEVE